MLECDTEGCTFKYVIIVLLLRLIVELNLYDLSLRIYK